MTDSARPSLSSVLANLYALYDEHGMRILGGYSPYVVGGEVTQSTFVAKNESVLSTSGGIAVDEMAFMYGLCEVVMPKRVLVVGNSYGISTLLLALVNPTAKLVALDKFRTVGIAVTNSMLSSLKGAEVIQASTPDDLHSIVVERLGGEVDFVFIDAVHENEVQTKEFEILAPLLSDEGVVVFHDVLSCDLQPSLEGLGRDFAGWNFTLCNRTTTGIAVGFKPGSEALTRYLHFWKSSPSDVSDFDHLMRTRWTSASARLFSQVETRLRFPPHPQL